MRWVLMLALLLCISTSVSLIELSSAQPPLQAVGVDSVPFDAARQAAVERERDQLRNLRDAVQRQRERLRAVGRGMAGELSERQMAWIALQRDDISLRGFERPYWERLLTETRR